MDLRPRTVTEFATACDTLAPAQMQSRRFSLHLLPNREFLPGSDYAGIAASAREVVGTLSLDLETTMNTAANAPLSSESLFDVSRSWWVLLLYGIVAIIFGLMAVTRPVSAAAALAWGMGVVALIESGISVAALFNKNLVVSKGWIVLYMIVSLLFGVSAVVNPLAVAGTMVLLLAAWLFVAGVFRIVFALRVRKAIRGEWLLILSGVLAIVLGILFSLNPLSSMVVTTLWIGVGALFYGVVQVFAAFRVRKLGNP